MEQTDQPGPNVLRSAVVAVRLKVEVSLSSSFRNNDGGQMFVSSTHFLDMAGPTPLKFPFLVWQKASDIRYRKIGPFSQDFLLKRMGWSWSEKTNQSISECFGADLDGAEPASTWHHAESVLQSRKKKAVWFSSVHEKVASTEHSQPLQSTCIFWSLNLDIECNPYQSFNPSNCLVHVSNPLLRVCRGLGRKLRRDTAEILRSEEKLYMCQNLLGHLAIWLLRSSLTHASLDWDGEKQDTDTLWRGLFALSDS